MTAANYEVVAKPENRVVIKAWTKGVLFEDEARAQLDNIAKMPFVGPHIAVMPDVHWGNGTTVGSVIATRGAIIPAAVGVDIGCGMIAVQTTLTANDLPENLALMRHCIESAVPHGRTNNGGPGDRGAWTNVPARVDAVWAENLMQTQFEILCDRVPHLAKSNTKRHLGTLGGGNHFVEICLDEAQCVWIMLHSGSRGIGHAIGQHYIEAAKKEMERYFIQLPDEDLAYLPDGSAHFVPYWAALNWAQRFAQLNREVMLESVTMALAKTPGVPPFSFISTAINCHHNYVAIEHHFKENMFITRKGAVSARRTQLGIIPGSMGTKSYIVQGKGNKESFCSCSHGAGRAMSRGNARKRFTVADHTLATAGVECRKDAEVVDETPAAYKDIDTVMAAQTDLVDIVHTLKQVLCVKG